MPDQHAAGLIVKALLAIVTGTAGANTITCYIDRDVDAVMECTRHRPISSGRISPPERALYWGVFLSLLSLVLALSINWLSFLAVLLGLGIISWFTACCARANDSQTDCPA